MRIGCTFVLRVCRRKSSLQRTGLSVRGVGARGIDLRRWKRKGDGYVSLVSKIPRSDKNSLDAWSPAPSSLSFSPSVRPPFSLLPCSPNFPQLTTPPENRPRPRNILSPFPRHTTLSHPPHSVDSDPHNDLLPLFGPAVYARYPSEEKP